MNPSALYEAIRARRVTRNMTSEPVDPEELRLVAHSARYAPNAGNRRIQIVVPIAAPNVLHTLRSLSPGMLPRPQAAIVICIDRARATGFGLDPESPGLFIDVGTAAATMLLAAESLGLGACPVTSFSRAAVARLLDLDAGLDPRLIVCLGHPASTQPPPMETGRARRLGEPTDSSM